MTTGAVDCRTERERTAELAGRGEVGPDLKRVDLRSFLEELTAQLIAADGLHGAAVETELHVDALIIDPDRLAPLALFAVEAIIVAAMTPPLMRALRICWLMLSNWLSWVRKPKSSMPRWVSMRTLRACCKAGSSSSRLATLRSILLSRLSGMPLASPAARKRSQAVLSGM